MSEPTMRIWKYPIRPDLLNLRLPADAKMLCVGVQNGEPQLWVLLDKEAPLVSRSIRVYGTGHPMDDSPRLYIGTFFLDDAALVFHVFEELAAEQPTDRARPEGK